MKQKCEDGKSSIVLILMPPNTNPRTTKRTNQNAKEKLNSPPLRRRKETRNLQAASQTRTIIWTTRQRILLKAEKVTNI